MPEDLIRTKKSLVTTSNILPHKVALGLLIDFVLPTKSVFSQREWILMLDKAFKFTSKDLTKLSIHDSHGDLSVWFARTCDAPPFPVDYLSVLCN